MVAMPPPSKVPWALALNVPMALALQSRLAPAWTVAKPVGVGTLAGNGRGELTLPIADNASLDRMAFYTQAFGLDARGRPVLSNPHCTLVARRPN